MAVRVVRTLQETIPFLPNVKKGTYDPSVGTFVLVGGSSYKCTDFDTFDVAEGGFYRKFDYEAEYPHINFQTRLARQSATFSFDRPTDLLNHNLYAGGKHRGVYVASWSDLTMENYARFMRALLDYHRIRPPYLFVACSEGGYDVLCFARYYASCVKRVYFIDTPIVGTYWQTFEALRGNGQWYDDLERRKFSWEPTREIDFHDEETLKKIDVYNFEVKTVNVINKLDVGDFPRAVPMVFFWSPYLDSAAVSREKVRILRRLSAAIRGSCTGAMCLFVDAPHQVERVLPVSLSAFITRTSRAEPRFASALAALGTRAKPA